MVLHRPIEPAVVFKSVTRRNRNGWTSKCSIRRDTMLRFCAAQQTATFDFRSQNLIVFWRAFMPSRFLRIWLRSRT